MQGTIESSVYTFIDLSSDLIVFLSSFKEWKDMGVIPTLDVLRPSIKVQFMSSDINHCIDTAAPSQTFSTWEINSSVPKMTLGSGLEHIIVSRIADRPCQGSRHIDCPFTERA